MGQSACHVEPRSFRHPDIEEHYIGPNEHERLGRLDTVAALAEDLDVGVTQEQLMQRAPREWLVLDDERANR